MGLCSHRCTKPGFSAQHANWLSDACKMGNLISIFPAAFLTDLSPILILQVLASGLPSASEKRWALWWTQKVQGKGRSRASLSHLMGLRWKQRSSRTKMEPSTSSTPRQSQEPMSSTCDLVEKISLTVLSKSWWGSATHSISLEIERVETGLVSGGTSGYKVLFIWGWIHKWQQWLIMMMHVFRNSDFFWILQLHLFSVNLNPI